MECDICLLEWDSSVRIPRLLRCGHTFCETCLRSVLERAMANKKIFACPTCCCEQDIVTNQDISNLIKNFNLLRITEKIEKKRQTVAGTPMEPSSNQKNKPAVIPVISSYSCKKEYGINKSQSLPNNKQNFSFDINTRCIKHKLPIHSYAIGTNIKVCSDCIKDSQLNVHPLPHAVNEIKIILDHNDAKVCLLKNQIERLQNFFESYMTEFEKANSKKIKDLFTYFHDIVNFFHNSSKQMLDQCLGELRIQIGQRVTEIKGLNEELSQLEKELITYMNEDTSEMLKKIDRIKKIESKLTNFINYNLEFDLLTMNIGLHSNAKNVLFTALEQAYHVDVEFLAIKDAQPTIGQILKNDKSWPCVCGDLSNEFNAVRCGSCNLFRRYETISYFFSYPNVLTEDELSFVDQRRKEEESEYKRLLCTKTPSKWNAIDAEWFNEWRKYVYNDTSNTDNKSRHSANKKIGILPPGPIRNWNLLSKPSKGKTEEIRPKMIKDKDYFVINKELWDFFFWNYNGGPEIEMNNSKNVYEGESIISKLNKYEIYSTRKDRYENEMDDMKNTRFLIEDNSSDSIINNFEDEYI